MERKTTVKHKIADDLYLADWAEQMGQVLRAGLTMEDGIILMLEDEEISAEENKMLEGMLDCLRNYGELSNAMEEAGVFPQEMIRMVVLGERTGHLENILYALKDQYERQYALKKSIRNIIVYPVSISMVMLALISIILIFVMPVFKQAYGSLGLEMTGLSLTFYTIGNWLGGAGLPLLLLVIAACVVLLLVTLYQYKYQGVMPFAQALEKQETLQTCRFAGVMAISFAGGTTTEDALDMAMELNDDSIFENKLVDCKERVEQGERFYEAVAHSGILKGRMARRIQMGEKTAELDTVMQDIANDLQDEIDQTVERRMSHIEPVLIGVLSGVSALILFSVILPLLGVMSTL